MISRDHIKQHSKWAEKERSKANRPLQSTEIAKILFGNIDEDKMRLVVDLVENIKKVSGHVRLYMHPFYDKPPIENNNSKAISRVCLDDIRRYVKGEGAPVILFEESYKINQLIDRLKQEVGQDLVDKIIIIPTFADSGLPDFLDTPDKYFVSKVREENENILGNLFYSLGIKSATLRGMYLDACIHDLLKVLRPKGFMVDISSKFVKGLRFMDEHNPNLSRRIIEEAQEINRNLKKRVEHIKMTGKDEKTIY